MTGDKEASARDGASPFAPPSISLPKGGGAVRGIGEKFAANPVTGTGSLTVPLATSPGRGGFGPQLALAYDSGSGNGPFGFGWSLALPAITRKTDKGLPQYLDGEESDVFLLSGAEDLVPTLVGDGGEWVPEALPPRTVDGALYHVRRYRPRVEGLFARIERWTAVATGETHWRSVSRDNVTTLYGHTANSRIADPADPGRVFSWLICASHDDKGNAIVYEYKPEDSAGAPVSQAHEANRTPLGRSANRYLKSIRYGNRTSRLAQPDLTQADWMFEVVFDYGEHDPAAPTPGDAGEWPVRRDPFSSYRAGFEVRTYRLCQRVLMFHHFPDEPDVGRDCLVRSTDFAYQTTSDDPEGAKKGGPVASFIASVTQTGYRRQAGGGYVSRSLPPLEFEYTQAQVQEEVREIDPASLENLPAGLDGTGYQWVDLDGEGVSGALTEQAGAWFYKPNLGGGRFGPVELVATRPALAALAGGGQHLLDLAGDGQLDLVAFGGPAPGFFERTEDRGWGPFRPFVRRPDIPWDGPNLRFVDLDGDGHADVLVTEDDAVTWYPSLAADGFGPARRVARPGADEEAGPRLVFADGTQSVYLADMSGDGLADLVRVRNGEVCYWPNLGYGRFGPKVAMDDAPWLDAPEQFDQRRVRLADIDGSGTTDLIYLGRDGVRLYFNQSGNRWSAARPLSQYPPVTDVTAVAAADLLGNGTACLVWSSPLPADARAPVRFIDLMGGQKPHLLVGVTNNLGAQTRVAYAPSTKFYLEDKANGRPWVTRLPFPVHVVERVETYDRVSRNRFVTRYAYHHGYFDGIEREFRGFGMVEQTDTEEIGAAAGGALPAGDNFDAASFVPPVLTRTWFHTGAFADGPRVSKLFEHEYYREPGLNDGQLEALLLPDTVLPEGLTPEDAREACRALKGSVLRQEVFALDGSPKAGHPYSVSERNYGLRMVQPLAGNRHAVFFAHPLETVDYHYERALYPVGDRALADPRVSHALTLAVDEYGNVLESAAVVYGRRFDDPDDLLTPADRDRQKLAQVTHSVNRFTSPVLLEDDYRTPLPCEARTFEILLPRAEATSQPVTRLFRLDEVRTQVAAAGDGQHDLPYENVAGTRPSPDEPYRRLIEHARTLYRRDDLTGPLPLGGLESLALPFEGYKLAFTPGLVTAVYGDRVSDAMLTEAGYVHTEGDANWWLPSGRVFFSPGADDAPAAELAEARGHFFLPRRFRDPFLQGTTVTYDAYDLLILETQDPLGNRVTAGARTPDGAIDQHGLDYRVLQARLTMGPNRNRSAVAFDALGLVVGVAVMGKPEEVLGDSLEGFDPDLSEAEIADHLASPLTDPHAILGRATSRLVYDLFAYRRTQDDPQPQPAVVYTLARETHDADLAAGEKTKVQHGFSYSDGFGREVQKKVQAEPGPLAEGGPDVSPRWVGSGWTVFNNKGSPVRQYEPFFSATHRFEFDVRVGVSPVLFYDPAERVVATLHPNHTWEKVVFDPWRQETWDVNDTVLAADPRTDPDVGEYFERLTDADYLPTWHAQREGGALGPQEQEAARKAAVHAGTPTVAHADALGRTFLTVAHNKFKYSDTPPAGPPTEELYATRVLLDIEGNQREVIDARGRVVMRYDYDMLGNRTHQASMEAGQRWGLNDVTGKPQYAWDSRGHQFRTAYDPLRRPTESFLREGTGPELLVGRMVYGETRPDPEASNLRGTVVQLFDQAGALTSDEYDFKGNLRHSQRQLAREYKTTVDWSAAVPLEADTYASRTRYDALSRPTELTAPDNSVIRPAYNEAGLLERVEANLRGAAAATPFVTNIDYNAKGQRTRIDYGNGARTAYEYDPLTFRLTRLTTTRPAGLNGLATQLFKDARTVQDLNYTYDPAGNLTRVADDALPTLFFANEQVGPVGLYTYDAVYRLMEAQGREHAGQSAFRLGPAQDTYRDYPYAGLGAQPFDPKAVRNYTERYRYDDVGNFLQVTHQAENGAWRRDYRYEEASLVEPGKFSNRLSATALRPNGAELTEPYAHDAHGNVTAMPHLTLMRWDFKDQLQATARQVVNEGTPEATYYVYNAAGQRVRKVTERRNGTRKDERAYVGAFEVYREYGGDGAAVTLTRESVHVMAGKQRLALVETRTDTTTPEQATRYQLGNHLGSASLELDDAAQVISYEEYFPYGGTSYQAGRNTAEVSLKRYRYTGKERDGVSGLYYHGARYYAPWLGRWTSCDPGGVEQGSNLFRYSSDNPVRFRDPDGQSDEDTVKEAIISDLEKKQIPYTTELEFYVLDEKGARVLDPRRPGQPLIQRMDVAFAHPETGQIVFIETKGAPNSSKTYGQQISHPRLEKGANWEIKGHKGGNLGLAPGVKGNSGSKGFALYHKENLSEFKEALRHIPDVKRYSFVRVTADGKRDAKYFASFEEYEKFLAGEGIVARRAPTDTGKPHASEKAPGESPHVKGTLKEAAVVAGVVILGNILTGGLPTTAQLAKDTIEGVVPLSDLAQAKDEGDTAIPIMLHFAGAPLAKWFITTFPGAPQVAAGAAALGWGVPQAAGRGIAGHMLGAKGGYGNLVCYYPGMSKCK